MNPLLNTKRVLALVVYPEKSKLGFKSDGPIHWTHRLTGPGYVLRARGTADKNCCQSRTERADGR